MKQRRVYYRWKGKSIILEGRLPNGKPLGVWTLPNANKFISEIIGNASFLTFLPQEKQDKIREKYMRLDYKKDKANKLSAKVRPIIIKRSQNKDAKPSGDE